jgi:hypothetical protein
MLIYFYLTFFCFDLGLGVSNDCPGMTVPIEGVSQCSSPPKPAGASRGKLRSGMPAQGTEPPIWDGGGPPIPGKSGVVAGVDPRSPANRGWGWGWGSGVPCPVPAGSEASPNFKLKRTIPLVRSKAASAWVEALRPRGSSRVPTFLSSATWGRLEGVDADVPLQVNRTQREEPHWQAEANLNPGPA